MTNSLGTIASEFSRQVARTPDATAVICGGQALSYRELHDRANRLAAQLRQLGVQGESLVGIYLDRSVDMVVALWAVLQAGAAYVPLDPSYPAERTRLVIDDSQATAIVSSARLAPRLPTSAAHVVIAESAQSADTSATSGVESPALSATADSLAYVIYTSGSTGKPKGVMVEHRQVLSFFAAMDDVLGTAPGVWLAVTSISFDISVLELLWTLTRGYTVVLHGDEGTHTLADEIERHAVTHLQSTPSLARMLAADSRSLVALGRLRTLLLGGEALPTSLVSLLRPVVTGDIFNMYGPTETTVWSTIYPLGPEVDAAAVIPIGRPLSNTHAYVLNAEMHPVPAGEPGELYLVGTGVVRGYWRRPELSAERFLPDPFASNGRMYRTGDLARAMPDGNLEFLGRTDFQVKLRGYRIELGEIEAALERLPGVRQAVVVARAVEGASQHEEQQLVAYCVLASDASATAESLRGDLKATLPDYMVPAHFVILDQLPLTANGKIDRQALADIQLSESLAGASSSASEPATGNAIEQVIAAAWARALGVEQVDLDANIFDLGVTSLMVPEVLIELQQQLSREIPLVDLFQFHTVRTLAAHLGAGVTAPQLSTRGERRRAARDRQTSA